MRVSRAGWKWLSDVYNHATRGLAIVALLIGGSFTGFLAGGPFAALAAAILAVGVVALGEGAYVIWCEAERERGTVAMKEQQERRASLVAMRSVLVELDYAENRIEEGPLGGEPLPNTEWARHKDLIAGERGDVFVELDRAYQEANRLVRTRATDSDDAEVVEYAIGQARQAIWDAKEVLGEWENELMAAERTPSAE